MNRHNRCLMLFAVAAMAFPWAGDLHAQAAAPAPKSADERFTDAYVALVNAESAQNSRQNPTAIREYRNALELYVNINNDFPGWRANVVKYRIAECLNQIRKLEQATGTGGEPAATGEDVGSTPSAEEDELVGASGGTGAEAFRADAAEPAAAHEMQSLKEDRDFLVAENKRLRSETAGLQEQKSGGREWYRFWRRKPAAAPDAASHRLVVDTVKSEAKRLVEKGEPTAAVQLLREAVALFPKSPDLRMALGGAYCQAGGFRDALDVMETVAKDMPDDARVQVVIGTAYIGLANLKMAQRHMEAALRLDPNLGEAHYNLAQIYLMMNPPDPARANNQYRQALEVGAARDAGLEEAIRRAYLLRKTSDLGKKKLVPSSSRKVDPVGQGEAARNLPVQQGQPTSVTAPK